MRKLLILLTVLVFGLFLASPALALTYTIPIADLNNPHFIDQNWSDDAGLTSRSDTDNPGWERYHVTGSYNSEGDESKVGIGDSFDWDDSSYNDNAGFGISSLPIGEGGMGDLTAYDKYSLTFHNPNETPIHVNLFLNTGWTDSPYTETDTFSQNGWTWLGPNETAILYLNLTGIPYLNHVSNIGFQTVFHDSEGNWGQGTGTFSVDVKPTPEPATLFLLGSGLVCIAGFNRKKFFK